MGLLDKLTALKYQPTSVGNGLINMGAQMMQAGSPSRVPQSLLGSLGQGIQGFNEGYGQQQQVESAQLAAQQKALLDAATIRKDDAQAGYYAAGGAGGADDGYHQPIQTSQGWAKWNKDLGDYELIKLNGSPALPVSADAPLAGKVAGAKADAGNTMQKMSDGSEVLTRNADITGPYNNPGNLRPQGQSTGFQQFATPEDGMVAIDKNLQAYGSKYGIDTLSGVLNRWAPPSENNTQAYIDDVSKRLGLHPDKKIDLNNPVIRQALSTAITLHEAGPSKIFGQSTLANAEAKKLGEVNGTRTQDANDAMAIMKQAAPLLKDSTNSGAGALVDSAAGFFGQSTKGADTAAQLAALGGALVSKMPKMSGPQSDKDVLLYKEMAGKLGDPTVPMSQKKAAMETMMEMQGRYSGSTPQPLNFDAPKKPGATGGWSVREVK